MDHPPEPTVNAPVLDATATVSYGFIISHSAAAAGRR